MKVKLTIPAGAAIIIRAKDGVTTLTQDDVESIEIKPFFFVGAVGNQAEVLHADGVSDLGDVIDRLTLVASGSNGKITRRARSEKPKVFIPVFDRPKAVKAAKPPETKP